MFFTMFVCFYFVTLLPVDSVANLEHSEKHHLNVDFCPLLTSTVDVYHCYRWTSCRHSQEPGKGE